MNQNEIASLAEEVKSFVDESLLGIEGKVETRLAEAAELVDQLKAVSEALKDEGENRKADIDDLADALDALTSKIDDIEAIEIKHGLDGKDGKDGEDGSDGIDGVNGEQGEPGAKGVDGIDGSDGAGIDAPIYKAGVYRQGSVVQANLGQYFKALQDTAEGVDHESWERVGLSGFRSTGAYKADREYLAGDLFIKDFGLFLSDGEESRLVAGRGPVGKKGEKGKDGNDGAPGKDGMDGDTFDVLELSGTNLVVVVKSGDGSLSTKSCDMSPLLEVAADITKSIEVKTAGDVKAQFEAHAKGLLEYISEHINDQEAIPLSFFRGLFNTSNSYVRGDAVTFGNALYVTSENTTAIPNSIFEDGNPWKMIVGAASGGGSGGSGDGGSGVTPSFVLTSEQGAHGGLRFSQFSAGSGDGIEFVGIQGGANVRATLTTDMIRTNALPFRNAKNGQFIGTPEELEKLTDQRKVNEFFYKTLGEIEAGDIDLEGYATVEQVNEVDRTSQMRDDALKAEIDQWDVGNTAVHLRLEQQIIREAQYSDKQDVKLQEQIDNISDALPENPNNSRAINIGDQVCSITGNRPSGAGGEAGKILIWKAEKGGPGSPYNECKFIAPDVGAIDLDIGTLWFKQGDKIQQWNVLDSGWITSGNVVHYSAISCSRDTLVDGQPIELWYEDPKDAPAEYFEVISRSESKSDDRKLQAEIEEIALALETLLVQREHGQWKYIGFTGDNMPRNAGEFSLVSDDLSSNDNIITLNQEDLGGTTHGFGDVEVGDYIEIVDLDEPANYVLFVVKKAPEGTGISNVEVSLKDKGQNFLVGETCEIRFFAINEQDLNLTELDKRYLKLSGGSMDGGATLRVNTLEPVNMPFIYYEGDPDNTHAAGLINRYMMTKYVDNAVGNIPKSSSPASAKIQAGIQMWSESRLVEGCFNLVDENQQTTSNCKFARGLTFHTYTSYDDWPWMKWGLRSGGQIHLTDGNGKYLMSKPVLSAEKRNAGSGDNPTDALWFFELSIYGMEAETSLSGQYFVEFENCLEAG